jgi:hypothetical protein
MADLDQRYGQWSEMARRARPRQTQQQQPQRYQGIFNRPQSGGQSYGTYNQRAGAYRDGYRNPNYDGRGTNRGQLSWNRNDSQVQQQYQSTSQRQTYALPGPQRPAYTPPQLPQQSQTRTEPPTA